MSWATVGGTPSTIQGFYSLCHDSHALENIIQCFSDVASKESIQLDFNEERECLQVAVRKWNHRTTEAFQQLQCSINTLTLDSDAAAQAFLENTKGMVFPKVKTVGVPLLTNPTLFAELGSRMPNAQSCLLSQVLLWEIYPMLSSPVKEQIQENWKELQTLQLCFLDHPYANCLDQTWNAPLVLDAIFPCKPTLLFVSSEKTVGATMGLMEMSPFNSSLPNPILVEMGEDLLFEAPSPSSPILAQFAKIISLQGDETVSNFAKSKSLCQYVREVYLEETKDLSAIAKLGKLFPNAETLALPYSIIPSNSEKITDIIKAFTENWKNLTNLECSFDNPFPLTSLNLVQFINNKTETFNTILPKWKRVEFQT